MNTRPIAEQIAEAREMLEDANDEALEAMTLDSNGLAALRVLLAATAPRPEETRLKEAIRRFTVGVDSESPNGTAEQALVELKKALNREAYAQLGLRAFDIATGWCARLAEVMAFDKKELCKHASKHFGEDFSKPQENRQA
jgi:hypothetical protein